MSLTQVRNFISSYYLAIFSAIVLLVLTFLSFLESYRKVEERNEVLFELRTENAISAIEKRMQDYIQVLRSTQALFAVSDTVSRQEWREFIEVLNVDENYPGILGLGYAELLDQEQVQDFQKRVQEIGFPEFKIWPEGNRSTYTSIIYLEPFNARNQRAFGFDMFTETTRRKAMKRARDTGKPSITGIVRLVQETNVGVQNGFVLYLPLYEKGVTLETVSQRRKALKGWVYSPFRVNDLMRGILKRRFSDLHIEIYDGPVISEESLLYDSDTLSSNGRAANKDLFKISPLRIAGNTWQLYITAQPDFGYEKRFPWFILVVGIIISSLVFLIMFYLTNVRRSTYLRQLITDNATAALLILNKKDYCTFANPAAEKLLGFSQEELKQATFHSLSHHHYPDGRPYPEQECPLIKSLEEKGAIYNLESTLFHKNGSMVQTIINAQPIYEGTKVISHLLEIRDIGPEKLVEKALLSKNRNLQTLNNIGKNLSAELELNKLLQLVTDSCTELTGAEFGAFFYHHENGQEKDLMLYTHSGLNLKDLKAFTEPGAAAVFSSAFHHDGTLRSEDITKDDHYGKYWPFQDVSGMHLTTKSYMAVPVVSRSGEVLGGLFFGHAKEGVFTESSEDIVRGIAAQAAIAIDNSRMFESTSQKNAELIKINNDLDNFVYTASHDLKSPVLNIEGLVYALTAALERNKPERTKQILDKIQFSISKFKETIQALTEVAKTNKNIEGEITSFNLKTLVENELDSIQDLVQKAGARIELDIHCENFRFSIANMRSILHNLLTNSIKYRSADRSPFIRLSCRKTAEGIILEITDNGLGIEKAYLNKIFTMFSRYHTHVEGTGIGLYLVNRIVENNGGTIVVESEVGKGTTFIISLPDLK